MSAFYLLSSECFDDVFNGQTAAGFDIESCKMELVADCVARSIIFFMMMHVLKKHW